MVETIEFCQPRRNISDGTFSGRMSNELAPRVNDFPDIAGFNGREAFAFPVAG